MNQERAALAVKERDIKLERDKQEMSEAERELTRLVRRQHNNVPPPPPPVSIQYCHSVLQSLNLLLQYNADTLHYIRLSTIQYNHKYFTRYWINMADNDHIL